MKNTLLWFASFLFLASLIVPTQLLADDPPLCDPTGCNKPGVSLVVPWGR